MVKGLMVPLPGLWTRDWITHSLNRKMIPSGGTPFLSFYVILLGKAIEKRERGFARVCGSALRSYQKNRFGNF